MIAAKAALKQFKDVVKSIIYNKEGKAERFYEIGSYPLTRGRFQLDWEEIIELIR